ncbi:esterase/lipase family protein, partial [Cutibacterium granulosum]|uniref:esterase/lipase family protein n=1 Tax=Cutibacterium granulosum TaxID=33011 RepID=UPI00396A48D8
MMNRLRAALLAVTTSVTLMGTASMAFAAPPSDITPDHPGGVAAPHSPEGVPSNVEGPSMSRFAPAVRFAMRHPGAKVPGTNDFTCTPRKGTHPVVLIPGTTEDAFTTWSYYGPRMQAAGLCVYTFNYNPMTHPLVEAVSTTGNIYSTAAFMAHFVDKVLKSTGADKVDLVGHSQGGGPLPRAYIKYYGGDKKVNHLIGIVPSNKGTSILGMERFLNKSGRPANTIVGTVAKFLNMESVPQQLQGSTFLKDLNAGGMTAPGVKYTVIATRFDNRVFPWTNALIPEPGAKNIVIQDVCPLDHSAHTNITYD